eukprot:IDg19207t1
MRRMAAVRGISTTGAMGKEFSRGVVDARDTSDISKMEVRYVEMGTKAEHAVGLAIEDPSSGFQIKPTEPDYNWSDEEYEMTCES